MRCILISFFNSNNIGDLLLSDILYRRLTAAGMDVVRCGLEGSFIISTGNTVEVPAWKTFAYRMMGGALKKRQERRQDAFWEEFDSALERADCIIIAGGNLLMELSTENQTSSLLSRYVKAAKKRSKPVYLLFAGAGPFQTPDQIQCIRGILNECDLVSFRDRLSLEYFKGALSSRALITYDPAFLYCPPPQGRMASDHGRRIGLNVINLRLFDKAGYARSIIMYRSLIAALLSCGYRLELFSSERNDYAAVHSVYKGFQNHSGVSIAEISNLGELSKLYRHVNLVIGARMHAMIVAAVHNIPVVGLVWQEKLRSFFAILEMEEQAFDFFQMDMHINEILDCCRQIEDGYDEATNRLGRRITWIREEMAGQIEDVMRIITLDGSR